MKSNNLYAHYIVTVRDLWLMFAAKYLFKNATRQIYVLFNLKQRLQNEFSSYVNNIAFVLNTFKWTFNQVLIPKPEAGS